MKFLLTSAGITNKSLAKSLRDLNGKPFSQSIITFIPTAANIEAGGMDWLIEDLKNLKDLKPKLIDIVDISALEKKQWLPRLKRADILVFGGGATFHLLKKIKETGLNNILINLIKNKIYVGISAGSMITCSSLEVNQYLEPEILYGYPTIKGLGLNNLEIIPHLNSKYFPKLKNNYIKKAAKKFPHKIYAIDDNSALKIDGKKIKIISEGVSYEYN